MLCHKIAKSEAVSQICIVCTTISLAPYYSMGPVTFFLNFYMWKMDFFTTLLTLYIIIMGLFIEIAT